MALMFAICSPQPNWMPRNPNDMFQICQKLRRGLSTVASTERLLSFGRLPARAFCAAAPRSAMQGQSRIVREARHRAARVHGLASARRRTEGGTMKALGTLGSIVLLAVVLGACTRAGSGDGERKEQTPLQSARSGGAGSGEARSVIVPAGTALPVRLETALSS